MLKRTSCVGEGSETSQTQASPPPAETNVSDRRTEPSSDSHSLVLEQILTQVHHLGKVIYV